MGSCILELQHSKSYVGKIRKPTSHMENFLGYDVIKLEQDFEFTVCRNKFVAKKGQYLAQCRYAPGDHSAPIIHDSWASVRREFHVFNKIEEK